MSRSLRREGPTGRPRVRTVSHREAEVTMDAAKPMVRAKAWVGVDVGKEFHWAVVVDAEGEILLSRRVENEEADLSALVEEVLAVSGGEPCWAVDQPGGGAALLLALLWGGDQRVLYIPGLAVDRARDGFRGETKTDRRNALVIAEQARMRRDLKPLEPADELLSELGLLLSRRRDLVADQSRALQRIRDALLASFPGLERALPDMRYRGALELLCRYQTPRAVLRSGRRRIETYLKGRGARNAAGLAGAAVAAAKAQRVVASAEGVAASIVAELAREVLALKERISALDAQIEARFRAHPLSGILTSLPGMGRSWARSSWRRWAILGTASPAPTSSPPSPAWLRRPAIPENARATTAGCAAATGGSSRSSTRRPSRASVALRSPGHSTTASGRRARGTTRR